VIQLRGQYQAVIKVVMLSFHGGLLISVVDAEKAAMRRRNGATRYRYPVQQ
jgi:hypothetical protein